MLRLFTVPVFKRLLGDSQWNKFSVGYEDNIDHGFNDAYSEGLTSDKDSEEVEYPRWDDIRIKRALARIPVADRDLIRMYVFQRLRQNTIAKEYGVTQGDISVRIRSACSRLAFYLRMPPMPKTWDAEDLPYIEEFSRDFNQMHAAERVAKRLGRTIHQSNLRTVLMRVIKNYAIDGRMKHVKWLKYVLENGSWVAFSPIIRR